MKRIFYFNITYRCNQKCRFCFSHTTSLNKFRRDVSVLAFKTILRQITSNDRLILNGGEPTLHSNFVMFLALSKNIGVETVIYSNGGAFENEKLCEYVKYYQPSRITIPIHGNMARHDYITQTPNSYKRTCCGIENLLNRNIPLELKFIITRETVDTQFDILHWLVTNGFKKTKQLVIAGQVNTSLCRLYNLQFEQDKEFGLYVSKQLVCLLNHGYTIKLYDICFRNLSRDVWSLIKETYDATKNDHFSDFYFFDGVLTCGRKINYNKCPKECLQCVFNVYCRKITASYLVLKIQKGKSYLTYE